MRIRDVVNIFGEYFVFGLLGLILFMLVGVFFYFIVYKKILKGKKNISKNKMIFGSLFIVYFVMVLGITFLNRGVFFQRSINIHFLSSYKDAWNTFSLRSWQLIILNIFMFLPFGFLLPLLQKKFYKIHNTLILAFLFTICIELFQLVTGLGVFDIDDVFNNMLGSLIGYGLIMAILLVIKPNKNKKVKIMAYLSPMIITILIFASIFIYHNNKEYGNIAQTYIYKLDLQRADIKLDIALKDDNQDIYIYRAPKYSKDEALKWANMFYENLGIDVSNLKVDAYDDSAIFWINGNPTYNVTFDYIGGKYSFTDFSRFDVGVETMNIEEDLLIDKLAAYDVNIPEEAEYIVKDTGNYQWLINKYVIEDKLLDGNITCTYFDDNSIKEISNNLLEYEKIKKIEVKSEKEAFEDLSAGKFQYYGVEKIKTITVKNVNLDYTLDSKGFYQPIYLFTSIINGNDYIIIIPAMKI